MRPSATLLSLFFLTVACDDSAAWHRMHPTLERMLDQRRGDPFAPSETFADGRAMRTPPPGTLSWGEAAPATSIDGGFVQTIPYPVTRAFLERGRSDFDIACAACHGVLGDSKSVVASKMELRPPPSLHLDRIRAMQPGEIASVIENGYGLMPSYSAILGSSCDVWAVVAYVGALQLSQHADVSSLPVAVRDELAREAP
jgi:mono/diheme cytochrome c family protein